MKIIKATLVAFAGLTFCAVPLAIATDDSFLGKWKLNPEKSQFSGLTYKVEDAGGDKYMFVFGDDAETVTFDGKPHVTKYGNAWSVTKSGPNAWKWTIKRDGKVISDAIWTVSDDGTTSDYVNEDTRPDGTTSHNETKLKRTAGTSGLVGTWESMEIKIGSPGTIEIANWKNHGYSFVNPTYKGRTEFKLDGKDYADKGPRVAKGSTVSAKRVDDRTIEVTSKLKGKTTAVDRYEVSVDGKTLTDTIKYPGLDKPEVDVYDRQ
jgi:hypothetical protein